MTREEEVRAAFCEGCKAVADAVQGKLVKGSNVAFNVDKAFAASEAKKRLEEPL